MDSTKGGRSSGRQQKDDDEEDKPADSDTKEASGTEPEQQPQESAMDTAG